MDTTPIDPAHGSPASLILGIPEGYGGSGVTAERWAALHDAAAVVAAMACLPEEIPSPRIRAFPVAIARADPARREMAEQGVEDIRAMMEPGLSALLAIHGRGGDTSPAAAALWDEFLRARDTVLLLIPDHLS